MQFFFSFYDMIPFIENLKTREVIVLYDVCLGREMQFFLSQPPCSCSGQ